MHFSTLATLATTLATAQAATVGFNYGSTFTDGSAKQQSDFEAEFNAAKNLAGTSGDFTSARLYTMIQGATADTPIAAIPAAIDTQTTLLLGLWASAGQADFSNEITALKSAISQYGTQFTDLIVGISVGSEDLYRTSVIGIENKAGVGAYPATLVDYISQVRSAIAGTAASKASVGHVDTWNDWVNGSNSAVIQACDWLGMDAYPYFENTIANGIDVGNATFYQAYDNTVGVAGGKEVWITETGWPVSGPQENQAVASVANAETYWQEVGCSLFGKVNTWWYVLDDALPTTPSPSFGILQSITGSPLYDLTCKNGADASSASSSSSATKLSTSVTSASMPASSAGPNTESLSAAAPGPETAASTTSMAAGSSAAKLGPSTQESVVGPTAAVSAGAASTYTTRLTTRITITTCPAECTPTGASAAVSYASSFATSVSVSPPAMSVAAGSSGVSASAPAVSSKAFSPSASSSSCPANLNGDYQYPHLIIPVDSTQPNTALGTQYNATINSAISTIFNFDLPASYAGKTCSLVFLFPEQAALETSAYTFNDQGGMTVNALSSPATQETSYNTCPSASTKDIGAIPQLEAGNGYVITSMECPAGGARLSYEFTSTGRLALEFFEDWNPSPLGAFVRAC